MKLYAKIENETGKIKQMGGDNGLVIDVSIKNRKVASLRVYSGAGNMPDALVFIPTKGETFRQFFGDTPENCTPTSQTLKGEKCWCDCDMSVPHYH